MRRFLAGLSLLALAACTSPREHLYALPGGSLAQPVGVGAGVPIVIEPVTVPGSVDRPQLVLTRADGELVVLEQQRWAEPLAEGIARTVAADLRRAWPAARITTGPGVDRRALRVHLEVTRFEAFEDGRVRLEALWRVVDGSGAAVGEGQTRTERRTGTRADRYAARVAAHAATLETLALDLEAAICRAAPARCTTAATGD